MDNILQFVGVFLVFVLILVATYFVTRWLAKTGAIQSHSKNIKVIETFKIAQNKYIQIVQIGTKYYSIGVGKDDITFLTPLDESQLDLTETSQMPGMPFKSIFKNSIIGKKGKKN